jgi:hypothetical protein
VFIIATLTYVVHSRVIMAEATAADAQMKDLSVAEGKKSKKEAKAPKAAKKPQQQKKKVSQIARNSLYVETRY